MRSLFEKNLMRMQSELRDLKTAQKRGLGTVRFYTKTIQATLEQGHATTITARFNPDGYFPGFAEIIGGPFYGVMVVTDTSLTYTASSTSGVPTAETFNLTVTSTTPIESLEAT